MNVAQSQKAKLAYIAQLLGSNFANGQETERVIYDTAPSGAGANMEFFNEFAGKTLNETNVSSNKLDSDEAFVIKNIKFFGASEDFATMGGVLDFFVGGQRIIKQFPIWTGGPINTLEPLYNDEFGTTAYPWPTYSIRLLTNIVIPPQVDFFGRVRLNGSGPNVPVQMSLQGSGILFNSGANY